jgi:hypothetical protein
MQATTQFYLLKSSSTSSSQLSSFKAGMPTFPRKTNKPELSRLKEFVDTTMKTNATAPVSMDINQVTTNSTALADFLTSQVTKATENLRKQMRHLQV